MPEKKTTKEKKPSTGVQLEDELITEMDWNIDLQKRRPEKKRMTF